MTSSRKFTYKKLEKLATLSFKNAIRLHLDSILLHENKSHATAFQISVLALEEFGKAKALEHFVWTTYTNKNPRDFSFEKKFIQNLYSHPWKQGAAVLREQFGFSKKFVNSILNYQLEIQKQKATYVGLERVYGKIKYDGKITTPDSIKDTTSQRQILLLNEILKEIIMLKEYQELFFSIKGMDDLLNADLSMKLSEWRHTSKVKIAVKYSFN